MPDSYDPDDPHEMCCSCEQRRYLVRTVRLRERGPEGQVRTTQIFSRVREGDEWEPVSTKLDLASQLNRLFVTAWPPESLDSAICERDTLVLRFRDHWSPFTKSSDYAWEARFNARTKRWRLIKVRELDYDAGDAPI